MMARLLGRLSVLEWPPRGLRRREQREDGVKKRKHWCSADRYLDVERSSGRTAYATSVPRGRTCARAWPTVVSRARTTCSSPRLPARAIYSMIVHRGPLRSATTTAAIDRLAHLPATSRLRPLLAVRNVVQVFAAAVVPAIVLTIHGTQRLALSGPSSWVHNSPRSRRFGTSPSHRHLASTSIGEPYSLDV